MTDVTAQAPAADAARPYRTRVLHKPCDTTTPVKPDQAQDMARDPKSWSTCWCNVCGRRLGLDQFTWVEDGSPVGS